MAESARKGWPNPFQRLKRKQRTQGGFRSKPRPNSRKAVKSTELTESRITKAVAFIAKIESLCLEKNRNVSREKLEKTLTETKGYTPDQVDKIFQQYYKEHSMLSVEITQSPPGFKIERDSGHLGAVVSNVSSTSLKDIGLREGAVLYKIDDVFMERRPHTLVRTLFLNVSLPASFIFRCRPHLVKSGEAHMWTPQIVEKRKTSIRTHMQDLMKNCTNHEISTMSLSGISQMSGLSVTDARESSSYGWQSKSTQNSEDGDDDESSSSDDEQYNFVGGGILNSNPSVPTMTPPPPPMREAAPTSTTTIQSESDS